MKKIFGFLIFLVLFFNVPPTFAAGPPDCDPSQVYIYNIPSPIATNQPATPTSDCNGVSGTPRVAGYQITGYEYCNPSASLGTTSSTASCWPLIKDLNNQPVTALSEKSINFDITKIPNVCGKTPGCIYNISTGFCETGGKVCPVQTPDCSGALNPGFSFDSTTAKCVLTLAPPQVALSQNFRVHLCVPEGSGGGSCDTALGKIPLDPAAFTAALLRFLVAISGAVILIMIIVAGYNVMTSSGDPQKLANSKEMIISLVGGIALIFFSIVLLTAIGVDILGIPGLKEHLSTTEIK